MNLNYMYINIKLASYVRIKLIEIRIKDMNFWETGTLYKMPYAVTIKGPGIMFIIDVYQF